MWSRKVAARDAHVVVGQRHVRCSMMCRRDEAGFKNATSQPTT